MRLRISARSSHLAKLQAFHVGSELEKKNPNLKIEYFFRESLGDKNLSDPLWKMPEKGVFTEDFYADLIDDKTDLVVHSWKDLPTERNSGSHICATTVRADQRDMLLFKKTSIKKIELTQKVTILSSSQRRIFNLIPFFKKALPFQPNEIVFQDIRGNIPTRLRKLVYQDNVDGLVLAKAALDRLLSSLHPEFKEIQTEIKEILKNFEFMVLPLSANPNAAAQGSLAIEIKNNREDLKELLKSINDPDTFRATIAEREILSKYGGGCHQKIGISVLQKDYGQVLFLKGLTDVGELLNEQKLIPFDQNENTGNDLCIHTLKKVSVSRIKNLFRRVDLPFEIPEEINGIYVSRAIAYRPFVGKVWTAGIDSWFKLAQQNIWVHGCSDSLGEQEDPGIDIISGETLSWGKLTHADAHSTDIKKIATYRIELQEPLSSEILNSECFFWMSGFQFELITNKYPELINKIHCCGVGNTYQYLLKKLKPFGLKPYLFLNEKQWLEK